MFVDAAGSILGGVLRSWGMDFSEIWSSRSYRL